MTLITIENVTAVVSSTANSYVADASELGFGVGEWPPSLVTELGNKMPLILHARDEQSATYWQSCGIVKLTVFNS